MNLVIENCKLSPVAFIESNKGDLRALKTNQVQLSAFGLIIAKISLLGGFKTELDNLTRSDILELISLKFKELSLDEVYYAFQLERFGMLENQTEHFQLFNAVYVSKVLTKYKKWKAEKIKKENIIINKKAMEDNMPTEEERLKMIDRHTTESILHFQSTGEILYGYLYKEFFQQGKLPKHTKEFKEEMQKKAIEILQKQKKESVSIPEANEIKRKIEGRESINGLIKEIILKEYYTNLLKQ